MSNVTDSVNMFGNCKSLTGAVPFDSTKTDVSMANYATGYLTYKSNNWILRIGLFELILFL